jgi:hypothetical protein
VTAIPGEDAGRQLSGPLTGHEVIDLSLTLAERLPGNWPGGR